jgi:carboxyl-terminal processing protease
MKIEERLMMKIRDLQYPFMRLRAGVLLALLGLLAINGEFRTAHAQTLDSYRAQGQIMLDVIKADIKKNYYDPSFHGVDVDASFKEASEQLKQAKTLGHILAIIGQTLMKFNDSHTFFDPPRTPARIDHGWQMQMIGDKCYVVAVKPGSDAEAKGLRPGDRILTLEGYTFTRNDLWKLQYILYRLSPRPSLKVFVEKPDGKRMPFEIAAQVKEGKRVTDLRGINVSNDRTDIIREYQTLARLYAHRYYEFGTDCLIWKMPQFDLSEREVDEIMEKARKRKTLILDLRGNGGGYEITMLRLIGNLFDHDVTLGELKRRKESKPLIAKTRGESAFKGQLILIVDSESGSAAEVLARVVQLEKRGTVLGDRTSGSVMRSREYEHKLGNELIIEYSTSVTDADIIMSDGQSLEHTGVTPDELLLPTPGDMAAQLDPVIARAAELAGLKMSPQQAGALFPVQWRK